MSLSRLVTGSLLAIIVLSGASACNYDILKDNGRRSAKPAGVPGADGEKANPDQLSFANVQARVLHPACYSCHDKDSTKGDLSGFAEVLKYVKPGRSGESELISRLKNFGGDMPGRGRAAISDADAAFLKAWVDAGAPEHAPTGQTEPPPPQRDPNPEPRPQPEPEPQPVPQPVPTAEPTAAPIPVPSPAPGPAPVPVPGPGTPTGPAPIEPTWKSIQSNVIAMKCVMCHSGATPKGDIDLTSYDLIANFQDSEADTDLLWKGDSSKSLLFTVIDEGDMPPPKAVKAGKVQAVTTEELEAIRSWIDGGGQP